MTSPDDLTQYFSWLATTIDQLQDEAALSDTVGVPSVDMGGTRRLLQALGYDANAVSREVSARQFTTTGRVDYVVGRDGDSWPLELKAPDVDCDKAGVAKQLKDYMAALRRPVGVLFNGRQARVYVNTDLKPLAGYKDLDDALVRAADLSKPGEMIELFRAFTCVGGRVDSYRIAKGFAHSARLERNRRARDKERKERIRQILREVLSSPGNSFIEAVINETPALQEMRARRSDLKEAWPVLVASLLQSREEVHETQMRPTRRVRFLVGELCRLKGLDYVMRLGIPNLRIQMNGSKGRGYYPIDGGPPGVTVGGNNRETALAVILRLEQELEKTGAQ